MMAEFDTGPIRLYRLADGRVTRDGIVIHDDHILSSVMFNHPDYHVEQIRSTLRADLPVRKIKGAAVMLSGPGYAVYGHWLVDILPRLWVLKEAGYAPAQLSYIIPSQAPGFITQLLETFGISREQIISYDEQQEYLEVSELLLPTNLRRASRLHDGMADARDYLLSRAPQHVRQSTEPGRHRIFVSRRNADPSRTMLNRQRIEEMAVSAGYEIVFPEEVGFTDQIDLFANCSIVMGEYGSGLHNTLFAKKHTITCALRGTAAHPGFIQSSLAHTCGQRIGYVFGQTPIEAIDQQFSIDERSIEYAFEALNLMEYSVHT
jgi:capsular polysaccharide biosynthesis protein